MRSDDAYVEDIMNSATAVQEFIDRLTLSEFKEDRKTRAAVERELITIGEAAKQLSGEFKLKYPSVRWERIIQVRNFYVHGYHRLTPEEVWGTAKRTVPHLLKTIATPVSEGESDAS